MSSSSKISDRSSEYARYNYTNEDQRDHSTKATTSVKHAFDSGPSIVELFHSAKKLLSLQSRVENRQLRKDNYSTQQNHVAQASAENNHHHSTNKFTSNTRTHDNHNSNNHTHDNSNHLSNHNPNNKVLDLLSPLSVDDLKQSSPPYTQRFNNATTTAITATATTTHPSAFNNNNTSKFNATTNSSRFNNSGGTMNQPAEVTPSSMNDSPPITSLSSSRSNVDSWSNSSHTTTPNSTSHVNNKSFDDDSIDSGVSTKVKREPSTILSPVQVHPSLSNKSNSPALRDSDSNDDASASTTSKPVKATPSNTNIGIAATRPKSNLTSSLSQQKQQLSQSAPRDSSPPNTSSTFSQSSGTNNTTKHTECHNCHTLKTPLWRKDPQGNTLCNACGLFLKLHGTTRPLSLKTDVIKKRSSKRASSSSGPISSSNGLSAPDAANYSTSSGGIPIRPNSHGTNGTFSTASTPFSHGSLTSDGPSSISTSSSRYKNVLILPKPPTNSAPGTSATAASSLSNASTPSSAKSIPIPNSAGSMPSSPFNGSNQQFKRKKSDVNIPGSYNNSGTVNAVGTPNNNEFGGESFGRRIPSQLSMSSKRNSLQSTFLNRRTSMTNLSSYNRKNSFVGLSSSFNNNNNNNTNGSGTPTHSLTPTNISLLNQKFANSNSYFENPSSFSYRNAPPGFGNTASNQNNHHDTTGSVTSQSSNLTIGSHARHSSFSQRHSSFGVPQDISHSQSSRYNNNNMNNSVSFRNGSMVNNGVNYNNGNGSYARGMNGGQTAMNVMDLLPSSSSASTSGPRLDTTMPNTNDTKSMSAVNSARSAASPEVEFFKSYDMIATTPNNDPASDSMDVDMTPMDESSNGGGLAAGDQQLRFAMKPMKSSLTDGLKNHHSRYASHDGHHDYQAASSQTGNDELVGDETKDLDWLKFDL